MSKFKVGDRVRMVATNPGSYARNGAEGIIKKCKGDSGILVQWETGDFDNTTGQCDISGLWYASPESLELVTPRLASNVWYNSADHKLEADEIEGRLVIEETNNHHFIIRYMLIDRPPEKEDPMKFYGTKPEVMSMGEFDKGYEIVWKEQEKPGSIHVYGSTESEAIRNWNEWVREHTK